MTKRTILAIGAHPDDVEIGMGGTIASHTAARDTVYICNLTKAELSSNGTVEKRQNEASDAAAILQVAKRYQLSFPDRGLSKDHTDYRALIQLIRELKPDVIFAPYEIDRHPDHGQCGQLVREALFDAGIRRYPDIEVPAHKTPSFYYYFVNGFHQPDFYVDISRWQTDKEKALLCYQSQFVKDKNSVETPLTNGYIERVRSRDMLFGREAGVQAAEGFKVDAPFVFSSIPQRRS
ncbi:bacillithiol biosynthesis deacetylase BshB1 [Alteribacillus iranensis]|uniref:Bacillithiol biosynthesis deacetylase BshB1 n=1 Tax=Alteribacillus iranensis TaxID=930128 RepID=A0A1I1ZV49_9BACI|nr:bacillithiol biosynthesis deacetylase BshB1 [Alteribacillus iranensis]SFE34420.1 bacillithiol biosynthesis deacetylase BshB1 [Alteribacillus iranensis]